MRGGGGQSAPITAVSVGSVLVIHEHEARFMPVGVRFHRRSAFCVRSCASRTNMSMNVWAAFYLRGIPRLLRFWVSIRAAACIPWRSWRLRRARPLIYDDSRMRILSRLRSEAKKFIKKIDVND